MRFNRVTGIGRCELGNDQLQRIPHPHVNRVNLIFLTTSNSLVTIKKDPFTIKSSKMTIDQWPVIRWAEKQNRWKADARTKDGGGLKFFHTRQEAEAWAQEQRIKRKKLGDAEFVNDFSGHRLEHLKKNDLWPVIRWEQRAQAWRVDCRTKNGGSQKFFAIRKSGSKGQALDEAEAFAQAQRIKRKNEGDSAFDFSAALRIDATAAVEVLRPFNGVTLRESAQFYARHHLIANGAKTVREVVDELLESKKAAGLSEKYLHDLRIRLGIFASSYGTQKLIDIAASQVDAYVLGLPNVTARTKNNHRRLLGVLFNFAVDSGYLLEIPVTKKSRSKEKYSKPDIFTVEESACLLASCQEDILPAVALGLFAGLRPEAELWRLDWRKIHLDRKKIDVDETKDKGDHASVRWVDMNDNLVAWLLPHWKKSGPICPTGVTYYMRIAAAKRTANIHRPTPDGLRHSFCSYHYALYQDAGLTSAQAGHTNLKTFFRHYRQRVLREDAERYFSIFPARDGQEKIVPIAMA